MLDRPGAWKRAGMTAVLVGLDLPDAMASLPQYLDLDFCRRLLLAAERAFCSAYAEANRPPDKG